MTFAFYARQSPGEPYRLLRRGYPTHEAAWRRGIWHMIFNPQHGIRIVEEISL